jgi:alcohol dehydrogenase class IV
MQVMEGADIYLSENCNSIIALGGGSVIDCAKGIGIVSTNRKHIKSFEGVDNILKPMPPLISIPTTGGTSADVSQFAIINNSSERYKMAIISKALISDIALVDPFTLTTMSNYLTACTGMDALSHAFEAFVSNANSPVTDLFALKAIQILNDHLVSSQRQSDDIELRGQVMLASLYAGLAFSNASLGCVHSLAHSLGGYLNLAHGECNAILLPHVVNYNFDSANLRYKEIASTMSIKVEKMSDLEVKSALTQHLFDLNRQLGIVKTLSENGVSTDIISTLASKAINDPCNATNPKSPNQKDLEVIYSEAM